MADDDVSWTGGVECDRVGAKVSDGSVGKDIGSWCWMWAVVEARGAVWVVSWLVGSGGELESVVAEKEWVVFGVWTFQMGGGPDEGRARGKKESLAKFLPWAFACLSLLIEFWDGRLVFWDFDWMGGSDSASCSKGLSG